MTIQKYLMKCLEDDLERGDLDSIQHRIFLYEDLLPRDFSACYQSILDKTSAEDVTEWYGEHINQAMVVAASGGHEDIVQLMLNQGADNYYQAMAEAAKGGHENIVQLMLEKGADDYNQAMCAAAAGGHENIVQLILNQGANNYNRAMARAAGGGHESIVHFMLDKGADDYNKAMAEATKRGHEVCGLQLILAGANLENDPLDWPWNWPWVAQFDLEFSQEETNSVLGMVKGYVLQRMNISQDSYQYEKSSVDTVVINLLWSLLRGHAPMKHGVRLGRHQEYVGSKVPSVSVDHVSFRDLLNITRSNEKLSGVYRETFNAHYGRIVSLLNQKAYY